MRGDPVHVFEITQVNMVTVRANGATRWFSTTSPIRSARNAGEPFAHAKNPAESTPAGTSISEK